MQILAITEDRQVIPLEPRVFDVEVDLQKLIRDHPRLLLVSGETYAGRDIWTIGYEVPTSAGSVDVLMLDSTGEVWVVETKLRKNPEVRKQVVGQVLAYASCVAEWTAEELSSVAARFLPTTLEDHIADSVGSDDALRIIGAATAKLRAGDLTCVVVVDETPTVLQRAVEFVNDHASFTILALQLEVVEHRDTQFVVPSVWGATVPKTDSTTNVAFQTLYPGSSEEFKALITSLDGWANERGFIGEVSPTLKSKKYVTGSDHVRESLTTP